MHGLAFDHETTLRLIEAARLAAVGRLLRPVAHQLSTPLAAIALRAESLKRTADEAAAGSTQAWDKHRRYLSALSDESRRCQELLSTVRAFAGGADSAPTAVDLVALCRGAARLVSHEALRRQVQVGIEAPAMAPVRGQSHSLAQAVLALLLNAVDASPQGGKVAVEVRGAADQVSVEVGDEGAGIPEAIRGRLFQPFVSSRGPSDGLGLGLMACRAIAEMHGGSLDWQPNPTRGTRFVLSVPTGRPAPAGGPPGADA